MFASLSISQLKTERCVKFPTFSVAVGPRGTPRVSKTHSASLWDTLGAEEASLGWARVSARQLVLSWGSRPDRWPRDVTVGWPERVTAGCDSALSPLRCRFCVLACGEGRTVEFHSPGPDEAIFALASQASTRCLLGDGFHFIHLLITNASQCFVLRPITVLNFMLRTFLLPISLSTLIPSRLGSSILTVVMSFASTNTALDRLFVLWWYDSWPVDTCLPVREASLQGHCYWLASEQCHFRVVWIFCQSGDGGTFSCYIFN